MALKIENKSIVVPGEILAEGMDFLPSEGAFREGEMVISSRLGLANVDGRAIKIIPLAGTYLPKAGDRIICKVFDVTYSGWRVDTNTAYPAMLSMKEATSEYIEHGADLNKYFTMGEYIVAKIINVTGQNLIDISLKGPGLNKLKPGRIIEVDPCKVPRVIGKQGSMVSTVKQATGCNIIVGQNGLIWLSGEPEDEMLAIECIKKIEKESHKQGLTEEIERFLKEKTGGVIKKPPVEEKEESRGPPHHSQRRRGPPRKFNRDNRRRRR